MPGMAMRNWFVRLIADGGMAPFYSACRPARGVLRRVRPFGTLADDGKGPRYRLGLVPARPARRRQRRALPRTPLGTPGLVRLRLRPLDPRRLAARRPARRVHR